MSDWMTGTVQLGELGPLAAQVNTALCGQNAVVRFARPEAEAIVRFVRRHGTLALAGGQEQVREHWDGHAIVLTMPDWVDDDGTLESQRIEPGEDGLWAVDAGDWGWRIVAEDWPERQEVTAALMADAEVGTMARQLRQARVVQSNTKLVLGSVRPGSHEAWKAAYQRRSECERAFRSALVRFGVPIGHLHQVLDEVYEAAGTTLVHSQMVVPVPYPVVTGMQSVETSYGLAYVAQVEFHGVPCGTFEDEGMGGELRFEPAGPDYRGPLAQMEAFADACLHTDQHNGREIAYSNLITEWEREQIVAGYPADGDRTLLHIEADFDWELQPIDCKPTAMRPVMKVRFGGELGDLVRRATRCRYWTGTQWTRVTLIVV